MMCSRYAVIAAMSGTLAASLILLPPTASATPGASQRPQIDRLVSDAGSASKALGRSAPGAEITLRANDRTIGKTVADRHGNWRITLPRDLADGDYRISVLARARGAEKAKESTDIAITVQGRVVAARATRQNEPSWSPVDGRPRAGEVADSANHGFDESMKADKGRRSAAEMVARIEQQPVLSDALPAITSATRQRIVLAQVQTSPSQPKSAPSARPAAEDDFLAPLWDWLDRSSQQYQSVIIDQLSKGEAATSLAKQPPPRPGLPSAPAAPPVASAPKSPTPPASQPATAVGKAPSAPTTVAQAPPAASQPVPSAPASRAVPSVEPVQKDFIDDIQAAVSDWLDRSNRQYQAVIVKRLSDPNPPESAAAVSRMPPVVPLPATKAPDPKVAAVQPPPTRAVEDAARIAEEKRREAEAKAKADAVAKAKSDAEAKSKADAEARAKAEAEARRVADAKAKADAEARAKAEAEARRVADAKAKADAEARAKADAEARRVADAKANAEAEVRTKAEAEARRLAEAKAKAEVEARAKAEAEARRLAEVKVESERKAAAAAAAVAAAAVAKAESERRAAQAKVEEEAKRATEARKVAEAATIRAQSQTERQAAEAARAAAAKAEAAKMAAEKAAAAKAASAAAPSQSPQAATPPRRVTVQRTVRPGSRFASVSTTKRRVSTSGADNNASRGRTRALALAASGKRRVSSTVCARSAGVRVRPGNWYVVARGDTLWHVAQMHYGKGNYYRLLRRANAGVFDAEGNMNPCQRLVIPKLNRTR